MRRPLRGTLLGVFLVGLTVVAAIAVARPNQIPPPADNAYPIGWVDIEPTEARIRLQTRIASADDEEAVRLYSAIQNMEVHRRVTLKRLRDAEQELRGLTDRFSGELPE